MQNDTQAVTTQETTQTTEAIAADQGAQATQEAKSTRELASPQLAILAKREKALQKQREELAKTKQEIELKLQEVNRFNSVKQNARQNPLKILEEAGLTYDELTQFVLNGNKPTPEMESQSVKTEIQKLREEFESKEKLRAEQEQKIQEQREQEAIETFKGNIQSFITQKPDDFELCNMFPESIDLIYNTIEAYFAETNKVMSTEEAAKLVESHYEDEVARVYKAKKVQSKYSPQTKVETEKQDGFQPSSSKTITNTMSQTVSGLSNVTEQDRIKRALAALGG